MVNDYKFYTCIRNLRNVCKHVHPGVSNDCDSIENISLSISVWRQPRYELTKLTGLQQEPLPTESVSTIHFKHPTAAQWTCTHSTTCTTRHGTSWGHLTSLSVLNRANEHQLSLCQHSLVSNYFVSLQSGLPLHSSNCAVYLSLPFSSP